MRWSLRRSGPAMKHDAVPDVSRAPSGDLAELAHGRSVRTIRRRRHALVPARHHVVATHAPAERVAADRWMALYAAHGPSAVTLADSPAPLD
jgi:hypothetical protein